MKTIPSNDIRNIIHHMTALIAILNSDGRVLLANQSALNLIEEEEEESQIIGQLFWETSWWSQGKGSLKSILSAYENCLLGHTSTFDTIHTKKNGEKIFIHFKLTPIFNQSNALSYLLAEGNNITDLRDAQRYLAASENRYTSFFEHTRDAIFIINKGLIIDLNTAAVQLFEGHSKEEFIRLKPESLSPLYQEDGLLSSQKGLHMHEIAATEGTHRFEWLHKKRNGDLFTAAVLLTKSIYKNKIVLYAYIQDITNEKLKERLMIEANKKLSEDIEERTATLNDSIKNLKMTQQQLIEKEKMASLGDLVAGIAHDISTPLGNSVMAASYLSNEIDHLISLFNNGNLSRSSFEHFLKDAKESADSILKNINIAAQQMTSFKKIAVNQSSDVLQSIQIKHYIDEIVLTYHSRLKKTTHQVEVHGDPTLLFSTYPGAFSQIISNFISNSLIHAFESKQKGIISISFHKNDQNLVLIYEDNGKGVAHENLSKIFDPYFTTKRDSGGSGLGLHIIHSIITQLDGEIEVSSELGQFTRFTCRIPEKHLDFES